MRLHPGCSRYRASDTAEIRDELIRDIVRRWQVCGRSGVPRPIEQILAQTDDAGSEKTHLPPAHTSSDILHAPVEKSVKMLDNILSGKAIYVG